ncbi:cytitidyltransferase [Synechococcus phage ACG-2014b]|uniref:Cytitidyltransferase n=2 Tax=Synechococcus phage ACG-2014b TaxID=1493508 RepID=A0A0E3EZ55_9CAUD|nr:cytidyltransferase [Synechococcus phage ACG-2014b]YP_009779789.1 cytidyltransferase [Synechococcus phage ACG-2014b]YP_009780007.1 cytidyltransferase [Synechococcus phage ACG-2014b]AIX17383.1 cytitidyltransferase [Synechococcus phage ACG-2014b]AIX17598.1 cytitidyltransferase [Synechococcus phage ACG-2014b]AIX17814.1 cytitidyltransferase [Synechococcus phage ACG-2014b]AIX18030.1 cytitidyltransferase [Synechococcus phage ACG-2014b]AIX18245.1 cytitidyltransferase [Synechococcus phage ACG-2014
MKKFSAFLNEAERSFASKSAEQLKLKHIGYGRYADPSGNITHMSKDGKLVRISKNDDTTPQQSAGGEETADGEGKVDQGTISITFGRFNPPTVGHEKLLDKVAREAKSSGGEYRIYPSRSEDPKKNPLDAGTKVKYMRLAYPDHSNAIVDNADMRTIFDVLTALDADGYSSVNIVVGGDRVSEFNSLAAKYNGDLYTFDEIKVVSAGDRDPDAEGVEGMSASKMRKAAVEGDYDTFNQGIPESLNKKDRETLYLLLRQAMKVEESYDDFAEASYHLHEVAPKLDPQGLREAYFSGGLFEVGTFVENVNTGIISKVVSRGSNYLISIDESDRIFRTWLKDLVERNDIKLFDFTPAGEMGTDKLANYMKRLTPGEFIRKINKKDKDAK